MNLPEDKEERKKILILIAIGVAAVCYVAWAFGISPMLQKKNNYLSKIEKLEEKLWRSKLGIRNIPELEAQNAKLIHEIIDISENRQYILHPNLGNYLLVASDIINQQAAELGLQVNEITAVPDESSVTKGYDSNDLKAPRLKPYTVNVSLNCDYYSALKLISAIETSNPYLAIVRIGIIGRNDNVMSHSVSFDVQWPIWIDEKQPIKLMAEKINTEQ
jgi:hypothetical protein